MRDTEWLAARVYGPLGGVLPWGDEIVIADEGSRFLVDPEFAIERLVTDEQAGSLIAMAFTANGDILASQEDGPLLLIRDVDKDGTLETVKPFCTEVKNVQGILPLGNRVYAVGDGPDGGALYQISDDDGDGRSDKVSTLVRFRGSLGEHGPHTVRLGPDGLLYLLSGNLAQADVKFDPRSHYGAVYEGELVKPRYEDPNGHAVGVPAPGGTILRTDMPGSFVEIVAGGFRNPYDFAFNGDGELFTYDADMEWDIGAPWYRPTRVNHVPPGGGAWLAQRLGEVARILHRQFAGDARYRPRLAHRRGVLRSRHVPRAAAEHAVHRRLGDRPDTCGEAAAQRRHLHGQDIRRLSKAGRLMSRGSMWGRTARCTSAPAAAAPTAASTACAGRAPCRRRRFNSGRALSRRCTSRNSTATGRACASPP